MQLCGFTLATKQPSMIAAALAGALHGSGDKAAASSTSLVTLIQRICRSQLGAAIGNVALVVATAVAFHAVYVRLYGRPFLDEHAAQHTLESFDPLRSGTLFFAALTGVLLWLSSLGAGWLENWVTYRRLPEAIATPSLRARLRPRHMRWLARTLQRNVAGIGGNVAIGLLLGMTPVVGALLRPAARGAPRDAVDGQPGARRLHARLRRAALLARPPPASAACWRSTSASASPARCSSPCARAAINHAGRRLVARHPRALHARAAALLPARRRATRHAPRGSINPTRSSGGARSDTSLIDCGPKG